MGLSQKHGFQFCFNTIMDEFRMIWVPPMIYRKPPYPQAIQKPRIARKCVLKDEKPELPIVLINEKGLISEGGLRDKLMKDIQVCDKMPLLVPGDG